MNPDLNVMEIDVSTGEVITRPMTEDEIKNYLDSLPVNDEAETL